MWVLYVRSLRGCHLYVLLEWQLVGSFCPQKGDEKVRRITRTREESRGCRHGEEDEGLLTHWRRFSGSDQQVGMVDTRWWWLFVNQGDGWLVANG